MYSCKNYKTNGGDKWVVGGTLEIKEGASVTGMTTATLVNDLTTGGADKALTAEQGKTLKAAVDAKYTAANATTAAAGLVKQSVKVAAAAGEAPTKAEFDALIAALVTAGIMAAE
jgi:hypothetical protein